jgi:hypothetical protein
MLILLVIVARCQEEWSFLVETSYLSSVPAHGSISHHPWFLAYPFGRALISTSDIYSRPRGRFNSLLWHMER